MKHIHAVTCILKHKDKLLLLKRDPNDEIYSGKWNFVCGTIEENEDPLQTAMREIQEETGITDARLVRQGELFLGMDKEIGFIFHRNPFLFEANTDQVTLDEENTEYKWIRPENILDYQLAPGMIQTLLKLMGDVIPERQGILAIVYRNPDSFLLVNTKNENLSFVAGGIDKDETEEDAVIRELKEESGIGIEKNQIRKLSLVNEFTHKKGFLEGIKGRQNVYLVKVSEDSEIRFDGKEITDAKWMNRDEVMKSLTFDHVKKIFEKSLVFVK